MGFDLFQKYWLINAGIHGTVALMYHSLSDLGSSLGWHWAVSLPRTQPDLLNAEGWQTACIRVLILNNSIPERSIVITFFDGYKDNLTTCEELEKRSMHATWFIVSDFIGHEPVWPTVGQPDWRLFNAAELRNMLFTNMEIDFHTANHVHLAEMDDVRSQAELTDSKTTLKDALGSEISSFAYPRGTWRGRYANAVREVGYRAACATHTDRALLDGDSHQLHRLTVANRVTASSLARKLYFGSNDVSWHAVSRYALQRVTSQMRRWAT